MILSSKIKLKHANKSKIKEIQNYFFDHLTTSLVSSEINKVIYSNTKIKALPDASYCNLLNITSSRKSQLIAKEISSNARSLISKIDKAKLAGNKTKYQSEILAKFSKKELSVSWLGNFNLDNRFVDIQVSRTNEFDYWIEILLSRGKNDDKNLIRSIEIPIYKTSHMSKLEAAGFKLKTGSAKITRNNEIILFYEKDIGINNNIDKLGIDIGINKAFVTNNNDRSNKEILDKLNLLKRKKHGSKHKTAYICHIRQLIDKSVKDINLINIKEIILEDLTNMKPGNKFGNRYHHWSYRYIQNRISLHAMKQDVLVKFVNPAYSSQTCSGCGVIDKKARRIEVFSCNNCDLVIDADYNAAINLSRR